MSQLRISCLLSSILVLGCGGGDSPDSQTGGVGGGAGGSGGAAGTGATGGNDLACEAALAPAGQLGGACRGETMSTCNTGFECIGEAQTNGLFVGGYCTLDLAATPSGCEANECEQACGSCVLVTDTEALCLRNCEREADSNGACRAGYACDILGAVCFPGCASDEECRDVLTTSSQAVCNTETYRCDVPGTPGAEAGDPCVSDDDCEQNGVCLDGPGGYCSKLGCDIEGNDCAGGGACAGGLCLEACSVGSDTTTDPIDNTQGCREGYTCYWDRLTSDPDGFCDTGQFNPDVDQNNIGDPCTSSDECYSPYGYGRCDSDFGCTVVDCGAPGVPEDICGDQALCVDFLGLGIDLLACLRTCSSAADCNLGDACWDIDEDPETIDSVCFPFCNGSDECRPGEVCNINAECEAPPS